MRGRRVDGGQRRLAVDDLDRHPLRIHEAYDAPARGPLELVDGRCAVDLRDLLQIRLALCLEGDRLHAGLAAREDITRRVGVGAAQVDGRITSGRDLEAEFVEELLSRVEIGRRDADEGQALHADRCIAHAAPPRISARTSSMRAREASAAEWARQATC